MSEWSSDPLFNLFVGYMMAAQPLGLPLAAGPWVKIQIAPAVNMPIPTKIGSKMGGEFTYQPKWDPKTVLTTTAAWARVYWTPAPQASQQLPPLRLARRSAPPAPEAPWRAANRSELRAPNRTRAGAEVAKTSLELGPPVERIE